MSLFLQVPFIPSHPPQPHKNNNCHEASEVRRTFEVAKGYVLANAEFVLREVLK